MTKIKNVLLASAFIVTVSTAANAATIVDATPATNADNDLGTVLSIGADSIVAGDIATGAVTTTEILDNTVTSADIAADTITAADLATGSVTTDEILDGTIGTADLSAGLQNRLNGFDSEINDLKGGVASAIAIATIPGVPAGKQFAVGLGGGTYDGENAGALKLSFAPQSMQSVQVNGSVTFSDSNTGAGVGVSYGF